MKLQRGGSSVSGGQRGQAVRFRRGRPGGREETLAGGRSGALDSPGERRREVKGGERRSAERSGGREGKWERSRGVDGAQRLTLLGSGAGGASRPAHAEEPPARDGGGPMSRPRRVAGPQRESRAGRLGSPGV